ncbi:nicotinamide-nucleotide amidase [Vibrio cincinnatiensis]|jgi:nicotinamide-nucleotide amidase|uniref:nicotinamide-nucleotide amidase n=1 Tax=Vibrio cincinnatiensis TaxID=675 RepID=UPI0012ACBA15|nr:nicotinamide-nucleotide amidase [Vibrio cincinnatiensis]MCG3723506.1 nicotinamide-nucleotide amidase [Vibrio cincinnatiensis]MCG3726547.1 nicotinamide-nucleotide amidase [Vibrio cincinnatiensis]MCG3737378.1 nicotinamide-nucleotide amidase [Vibrio cincinnatiensis]MCG3748184.1 nicotinamide-nucleotide amidase [Vibrio cincinnatiensis]MCG3759276.1 nicotinamide-nucleotide amidase [Vibrio cincinnatiensis]
MTTLFSLSQQVGLQLLRSQQVLTSAESCTGGGVAFAITDIPGSSAWFDRAFVTYSNGAKQEMIGVQSQTLAEFGAVSEPVVQEMVQGALAHSNATIGVAISGIAGPDGGNEEKPVGTVCFAWADTNGWQKIETRHFLGDRAQVRQQAIIHALQTLADYLPRLG